MIADRLWDLFQEVVFAYHYVSITLTRWKRYVAIYEIATVLITATSIVQMIRDHTSPALWATITLVAQIISVIAPRTAPFKKLQALELYASQLFKTRLSVTLEWENWFYHDRLPGEKKLGRLKAEFLAQQEMFLGSEMLGGRDGATYHEAARLRNVELAKYTGGE